MIGAQDDLEVAFDLPTPAWLTHSARREQVDVAVVMEREATPARTYDDVIRARPELRIVVLEPGDAGAVFEMIPHHETITGVSADELLALVRGASARSIRSRRGSDTSTTQEAQR
jgi:hypothetical protein